MPAPTANSDLAATSLDRSEESSTTTLYRAVIGTVNTDYYLPLFCRFEANDKAGLSWNGAASLYTLNWMIFRQLWRAALVYGVTVAGTILLVFGIGRLVFQFSEMEEIGLALVLATLSFVVPGLYGNALLHAASRQKMARALSASTTLREACELLARQASTRQRFIRIALINLALAGLAVAAYVLLPDTGKPPAGTQKKNDARNLAIGSATDLSLKPPIIAPAASAAPALAASASASAPATTSAAVAPAPAASKPTPPSSAPAAPAPAISAPVPASPALAAAASRPLAVKPSTRASAARPRVTASAPVAAGRFYINVGLFANAENAHNARRLLLKAGLPVTTLDMATAKGRRTRVRVGPFDTQAQTDAAVQQIRALQLDAMAIRL